MIICVCNNVNEAKVKSAIEKGAQDYKSVMRHLDLQPQCGVCRQAVKDIIKISLLKH